MAIILEDGDITRAGAGSLAADGHEEDSTCHQRKPDPTNDTMINFTHFYPAVVASGKFLTAPRPLVVCGPSGSGKSTLLKKLLAEFGDYFGFSVSRKNQMTIESRVT